MKLFIITAVMLAILLVMGTGAAVYAQTATPTTVVSPTTTTTPTTTVTPTVTPSPTGEVLGATVPGGAPSTGRGGM